MSLTITLLITQVITSKQEYPYKRVTHCLLVRNEYPYKRVHSIKLLVRNEYPYKKGYSLLTGNDLCYKQRYGKAHSRCLEVVH